MLTRSKSTSCSSNSTTMAPTLADVMSEIKSLKTVIHENAAKTATKEDVSELKSIIERQNVTIKRLEEKVESLENQMEILKYELDDKEQYQRRTSLRLFNVPQEKDENSDSCREKVIKLIQDEKLDIPLDAVDRAHRVGKKERGKSAPMIVKFSTFRSRTIFFRSRVVLKKNHSITTQLDLTQRRLSTLKKARNLVESSPKVKFVCANINCELMAVTDDDKPFYFKNIDDLGVYVAS